MLPASPCLDPTAAELAELEEENNRDNAIIDRLLRGASEDIEDVKARSLSRGQAALATTISRGETLLLIIHRQSPEQAEGVKVMVGNIRDEWTRTKQVAEKQRKGAKAAEKEVEKFTSVCSGLLV